MLSAAGAAWVMSIMLDPHKHEKKAGDLMRRELRRRFNRDVSLTSHEAMIASEIIDAEHIATTLDDVGGLQEEKQRLRSVVIDPLRYPRVFKRSTLLSIPRGILLYGPSCTGKTMLAKALARESGAVFINVKASTLQNKWYGETQKLIAALFTLASKLQPCVIFVDEVDALLGKRRDGDQEMHTALKTEFMTMWDGFQSGEHWDVVVLGATNRPWELDEAVLRRFAIQVEVPLPGPLDRARILHKLLAREKAARPSAVSDELVASPADHQPSAALRKLGEMAEGFSGSNLKDLCQEAARIPVHEALEGLDRLARISGVPPEPSGPLGIRALEFKDLKKCIDTRRVRGSRSSLIRGALRTSPLQIDPCAAGWAVPHPCAAVLPGGGWGGAGCRRAGLGDGPARPAAAAGDTGCAAAHGQRRQQRARNVTHPFRGVQPGPFASYWLGLARRTKNKQLRANWTRRIYLMDHCTPAS